MLILPGILWTSWIYRLMYSSNMGHFQTLLLHVSFLPLTLSLSWNSHYNYVGCSPQDLHFNQQHHWAWVLNPLLQIVWIFYGSKVAGPHSLSCPRRITALIKPKEWSREELREVLGLALSKNASNSIVSHALILLSLLMPLVICWNDFLSICPAL